MLRVPAVALLITATAAHTQPPVANAEIRAVADAFDMAQQHRDRAALDAMLAPDFLIVHGSGKVGGRADFIAGFTAPGVTLNPFVITDRLFSRISPDVAVVGGDGRISGSENGKPFAEHFRFSDTFVRRDVRPAPRRQRRYPRRRRRLRYGAAASRSCRARRTARA